MGDRKWLPPVLVGPGFRQILRAEMGESARIKGVAPGVAPDVTVANLAASSAGARPCAGG